MVEYDLKQINNLLNVDYEMIVNQSREEGFRFLERLVHDYEHSRNKFDNPGEALYGSFNEKGELIAIGGLNIDPFANDPNIGRVRRFYVNKEYRRTGLGSVLLKKIINESRIYFNALVLHTDTEQADKFYTSFGFSRTDRYPKSTHYLDLLHE